MEMLMQLRRLEDERGRISFRNWHLHLSIRMFPFSQREVMQRLYAKYVTWH